MLITTKKQQIEFNCWIWFWFKYILTLT